MKNKLSEEKWACIILAVGLLYTCYAAYIVLTPMPYEKIHEWFLNAKKGGHYRMEWK